MSRVFAGCLVFVSSAAVLVLEILAGRLLAPYVGVSLETYTAVIGTMLAGIAAGSWLGGHVADRVDPRRLVGPLVVAGGALALVTVPIVRGLGDASGQGGSAPTVFLALAGFFLPAAVLSAVTPTVVKLQLRDLHETGGVVGRLSGIGTLGALVGTFVTGFVLVANVPTRAVIYGVGATLLVIGIALWVGLSRRDPVIVGTLVAFAVGGGALATVVHEPCQVESAYFCMRVEHDPTRATGRTLWLDDLRHSYVDLDDPTHLEFDYAKSVADAVDSARPGSAPLDALYVGGGGFTLPRYYAATRPGSRATVLELDPAVPKIARERLELETSDALRVELGDARIKIRSSPADSADLVVGDAFGGLSVPWHLTTREFVSEVRRVLRPDGVYVINLIDYPSFRFARAELATLREQFRWVGAIASPLKFAQKVGGNVVLVASDRTPDEAALEAAVAMHADTLEAGADLDAFIADAPVLTDDYAPVDQWLVTEARA
ncbi:MAG: fused MFS/spermidine synthase [Acidimicrobiia bacterium]